MNKLKNATKRITAVGASALMASSAVLGAGLSDYPSNFVENGKFMGQVVVGASAAAIDSTSAASVIDDLKSEFSGDNEKVTISYKMGSSGGDERSITRSSVELNYGETIQSVTETFDDSDMDILEDGSFSNGLSDEDYEQTLAFGNGTFNHALRDEVDGVTEISDNIFYNAQEVFARYVFELDSALNLTDSGTVSELENDFVGEEMAIMGNEFTIAEITRSSNGDLNELVLIGGANKIALGEGESTTVTVDGSTYDIEVLNVDTESSTSKVLLTVNGKSKSVDEFDTEDISGVTVAVTDLVGSGRDSVKGYAEIVVGGQKVTLKDGNAEVEINEEDVSDVYEEYIVTSDFSDGTGMQTITITYKVDDDTSLEEGDMLSDVLFQGFDLVFDGTNNPEWSTINIRGGSNEIRVEGTLENGESFNRDLYEYDTDNAAGGNLYLRGKNDEDPMFTSSWAGFNASSSDVDANFGAGVSFPFTQGNNVTLNLANTGVIGVGFLLEEDTENQYLYEIQSIDVTDNEVDLDEILDNKDETAISPGEFATDLEVLMNSVAVGTSVTIQFADLGNRIAFENEALLSFVQAFNESMSTAPNVLFTVGLDSSDVDGDNTAEESDEVNISTSYDTTDDEVDVRIVTGSNARFVNSADADVVDDSSDVKRYVTKYGIMVEYDNDESQTIEIMIPDEQVRANVMVRSGGSASTTGSVTVDADAADDKEAELEEMGYTITGTATETTEEVEFDVSAPVLDSDVSGWEDMIVVGGPAVNSVAAKLLGMSFPTSGSASGVGPDEAVVRYFEDSNSVLVYGYEGKDTAAAADELNAGGLTGSLVNVG